MPDCNYCGRFINTSTPAWTCGCEGEKRARQEGRSHLFKPRIVWNPIKRLWHCYRNGWNWSGYGATPVDAWMACMANNGRTSECIRH